MTYRVATAADAPAIAALLRAHIQTSMFPLSNLLAYGLGSDAARGMRFWMRGDASGVYGETNEGLALPQMPAQRPEDWAALSALGCGVRLTGALGEAGQIRAMLAAWGQTDRPARHDSDEPGFSLDLDALRIPAGPDGSHLVPIDAVPEATVIAWRSAYHIETLGTPQDEARATAAEDVARWREAGTHRVLIVGGLPAALTGFNAVVEDVVQIGGVYTPPESRGRGLARRALALHLAEVRAAGATRAVLFAASDQAARAYTSIGFRPAGRFAMVLFEPSGEGI
ncbi:MAG: GNAT family N-acetyltransferase [Pseudomonadota bacterium]